MRLDNGPLMNRYCTMIRISFKYGTVSQPLYTVLLLPVVHYF